MNYYYVIIGSNLDYYKVCYNDLQKINFATYDCTSIYGDKLQKILYKIHNSEKINKIINLPYKEVWFPKYLKFNTDKPVCFVFFTNTKKFESIKDGYLEYLRKCYPKSKFVCFYQDIVALKRKIEIDVVKSLFDIVISYDKNDCEKYGLLYYPDVYSSYNIESTTIDTDVYFVGKGKDRLLEIYKAYDFFSGIGCKCKFKLIGISDKDKIKREGIEYYSRNISYLQVIKDVQSSYAILEIMQGGAVGYTLRTCEAIEYDKLLITNNSEIKNATFYTENNIKIIDNKKIDIVLDDIRKKHIFSKKIKEDMSPINLLSFLDERL